MREYQRRTSLRYAGFAPLAFAAGGLLVCTQPANAQDVRVVTANSSNNQLSLIDFDAAPNVAALNFDANERKSLRGIVIRNDFDAGVNLIVADAQAGEICWYADPAVYPAVAGRCQLIGSPTLAAGPQLPSALELNAQGDLFAGSSGTGNAGSKTAEIWAYDRNPACPRPGGYCDPVKVAGPLAVDITPAAATRTPVSLDLIDELRVYNAAASGRLERGDLLVLTSKPAALVILRGRGSDPFGAPLPLPDATLLDAADVLIYPAEATGVDDSRKFPAGAVPGGFAFAPEGRILVTTDAGAILSYGLDGHRGADFASVDKNGKFKIATALQRGIQRAFVADRNGGELLRFDIDATTGSGELSGSVAQGVQFPVAVAVTNATVVPVAASNNPQTIDATGGTLKTTFRQVNEPGVLGGTVYYVVGDPRNHAAGPSSFVLNQVDASLPAITIPPYVRGLPCTGPADPQECFVVVLQSTTAGYDQAIEVVLDPSQVLGWTPSCRLLPSGYGSTLEQLDRVFWGTVAEFGEPPILEGPTVVNVTARCNSPSRGIVREASIFIAGRDTRAPAIQTSDGLDALAILLSGPDAQEIDKSTLRALTQLYDRATKAFERLRYVDTALNLLSFADLAATVIGAPGRIGPELESRSRAAAFAVCSIPPAGASLTCDSLTGAK